VQAPQATPSDSLAQFVAGNTGTCAAVGFASAVQLSASGNTSESDGDVTVTATANTGPVQPGKGEELDVTITKPTVVVDAVVVKGGPAYNLYSNPAVLPPALPAPQHYIAPVNGAGNVPDIGHWFVCYHLTTPMPPGSLTVVETIIEPPDLPAAPLPTSYTVGVNCNDGNPAHQNVIVTVGEGGGESGTPTLTGLAPGTVCTVIEQNTTALPPGTTVTDAPQGVTIPAAGAVTVTVVDDFSNVALLKGTVQLAKTLIAPPPGVATPPSYTAHVACDDGTETDVTLPGGGGTGAPTAAPDAGASCTVGEDTSSLAPGWLVTYTVAGITSATSPVFVVTGDQTITVTITNDPSAVAAVTTVPPTPEPTEAATMPGTLPPTGTNAHVPVAVGLVLVAAGLLTIGYAARRRSNVT
jgi:hypothetical protein